MNLELQEALDRTGLGEYVLSMPGVGVMLVRGFLGRIGDPSRHEDWRYLHKLAGLKLVENDSNEACAIGAAERTVPDCADDDYAGMLNSGRRTAISRQGKTTR
ncbi:MAG TPA: IS110 family transposase [Firmicutes bacterium]|nr:IS110 family transposase [Bacillota bacterium]